MMELPQSSPAKTKFSIDSILQKRAIPSGLQWTPAAILQLQQQQQQQQTTRAVTVQPSRNNQYLIQFLLNSGSIPPFVTLNSPYSQQSCSSSQLAVGKGFSFPVAISPSTQFPKIPQSRLDSLALSKALQRNPPDLISDTVEDEDLEDDSDPSSLRRRQVSIDSAGASNDSEEEIDTRVRLTSFNAGTLLTSIPGGQKMAGSRTSRYKEPTFKKSRTSFTKPQIIKLEDKFSEQKYLTKMDRTRLAREVSLTEKHVKTWFQNRRTKWKKDCSDADWSKHKEFAAALMYGQYLETKNVSGGEREEEQDCGENS